MPEPRRVSSTMIAVLAFGAATVVALAISILLAIWAAGARNDYRRASRTHGDMVAKIEDMYAMKQGGLRRAEPAPPGFDLAKATYDACAAARISQAAIAGVQPEQGEARNRWRRQTFTVQLQGTTRGSVEQLIDQMETTHPHVKTTHIELALEGEQLGRGSRVSFSIFSPPEER